jgi:hypothetical protein
MERGDRPISPKLRITGGLILLPHSCRGLLESIVLRGTSSFPGSVTAVCESLRGNDGRVLPPPHLTCRASKNSEGA